MTALLDEVVQWVRSQIAEPDPADAVSQAMAEDARLVRRVLSGPDGERFLMLLGRLSVLKPALDPRLSGPAGHEYAQRRTGENGLFAALIHYRDLADALERKAHDRSDAASDASGAEPGTDAASDDRFTRDPFDDGWDPAGVVAGR